MTAVVLMALLTAIQVGLAVAYPSPITISGFAFLAILLVVNILMWRDRR